MKFIETLLPGVLLIEPDIYRDKRGFFIETYQETKYRAGGIPYSFVQDNQSRSQRGTLRGLHAQKKRPQGKLVRAIKGEVFDVAVDINPGSKTFGKWVGAHLSDENFRQIFVPPGYAHGFCVVSEIAEVEYKCTDLYDRADEIGLFWNDPAVGIEWPITQPLLSDKDARLPLLAQLRESMG